MKLYDAGSITLIILFSISIVIGMGNFFYEEYWRDDNPAEEAVERAIEDKTGVNIDLTPKTPENESLKFQ